MTIAEYIERLFPQFEPALKTILIKNAMLRDFQRGDLLMQTSQNMRSTVLIVKVWQSFTERGGGDGQAFLSTISSQEMRAHFP